MWRFDIMSEKKLKDPGEYLIRAILRTINYVLVDGKPVLDAAQEAGKTTINEWAGDALSDFLSDVFDAFMGKKK
jgi:hypothetical protein